MFVDTVILVFPTRDSFVCSERARDRERQRECAHAAKERDKSDGDHQHVHGWEVAEGVRGE